MHLKTYWITFNVKLFNKICRFNLTFKLSFFFLEPLFLYKFGSYLVQELCLSNFASTFGLIDWLYQSSEKKPTKTLWKKSYRLHWFLADQDFYSARLGTASLSRAPCIISARSNISMWQGSLHPTRSRYMEAVSFLPLVLCTASTPRSASIQTIQTPYKHAEALQRESSIGRFLCITATTTCALGVRMIVA